VQRILVGRELRKPSAMGSPHDSREEGSVSSFVFFVGFARGGRRGGVR